MIRKLAATAMRLADAIRETDLSVVCVIESDGGQLARDLEMLVGTHPCDESVRVCQSSTALIDSIGLLHRGPYSNVIIAASALLDDVVEYSLTSEPGVTETERSATEAGLRALRDRATKAVPQRDCP